MHSCHSRSSCRSISSCGLACSLSSRRYSMNESPYCGVNSMASSRKSRAASRLKCAEKGLRQMRAPSHHTSPDLGTSLSACWKTRSCCSTPCVCSSCMRTAHSLPVPRWTRSALRALRSARPTSCERSSSSTDSRKTFHSCRLVLRASLSSRRASAALPHSSCSRDCSSITMARVLGGDSLSARSSSASDTPNSRWHSSVRAPPSHTFHRRLAAHVATERTYASRERCRLLLRSSTCADSNHSFHTRSFEMWRTPRSTRLRVARISSGLAEVHSYNRSAQNQSGP
mmetsp:Transcript_2822/g.6603  ORF Transcript_2822/g.6603 Transcript_2822/m.6603 type:complete len:285 (-) Transcript_2822:527-1381(-)